MTIQRNMPKISRNSKALGVDGFGNVAITDENGRIWVGLEKENVWISRDTPEEIKWTLFILECGNN